MNDTSEERTVPYLQITKSQLQTSQIVFILTWSISLSLWYQNDLDKTFKLVLESVGYNVDTANTGLQAIYRMKQQSYELVLLDLNLPDTRGDMVAKMIEEMYVDVNIVFITGYSELMSEVEKAGDDVEVLLKPIGPENLLEVASRKLTIIQ